jgi:hypothetical protein
MAVNWQWDRKQGEIVIDGSVADIYAGNCLFIAMFRKQKLPDGKWEYYMPPLFFDDEVHMKRCLGITKDYNGEYNNLYENQIDRLVLYRNKWEKADFRKVVSNFALMSGDVTIKILADEPKEEDAE